MVRVVTVTEILGHQRLQHGRDAICIQYTAYLAGDYGKRIHEALSAVHAAPHGGDCERRVAGTLLRASRSPPGQ